MTCFKIYAGINCQTQHTIAYAKICLTINVASKFICCPKFRTTIYLALKLALRLQNRSWITYILFVNDHLTLGGGYYVHLPHPSHNGGVARNINQIISIFTKQIGNFSSDFTTSVRSDWFEHFSGQLLFFCRIWRHIIYFFSEKKRKKKRHCYLPLNVVKWLFPYHVCCVVHSNVTRCLQLNIHGFS